MNKTLELQDALNRRTFLKSATGLGLAALGLLEAPASGSPLLGRGGDAGDAGRGGMRAGKAKRIIYLFQSGAPSQFELFDHKPLLEKYLGQDLPESVRRGQRLTTMTSGQSKFPIAPSALGYKKHGQSGIELSDGWKWLPEVADDLCVIRTMNTEAINHDPAVTFLQTGSQLAGRPSIGSWLSYGLGTLNKDLPAYIVLTSKGSGRPDDQPLYDRLWGSGFLPTQHQGVKLRNAGDPVLYLSNPDGVDTATRREMLDELGALNRLKLGQTGDPEIATRIAQYELAFRMQASVPELADLSTESAATLEMYGPDVKRPGSYAYNCLLARRLCEKGVRFVQLFHMGWDHHGGLPSAIKGQLNDTDQATTALLKDLKQRGLLEDTLVVWGGEFGRTVYSQGALSRDNYGRDHHPRCYSMFLAGAGIKKGLTYGETDDFSYNIVKDPVNVHDLHATLLHLLGIDHKRLTFPYQGRDFRLTDVYGELVKGILA